MYRIGLFGLVASGHAGFALGVGKRALVEVLAIAETQAAHGQLRAGRPRSSCSSTSSRCTTPRCAPRARTSFETFADGGGRGASRRAPRTLVQQQRMRQATTYATRVAADAARFAYTWAGTDALRNPSVLQRCFRDIHAGTQHIYVDNNTLTGYTQALLMTPADER